MDVEIPNDFSLARLFAFDLGKEMRSVGLLCNAISNTAAKATLALLKPDLHTSGTRTLHLVVSMLRVQGSRRGISSVTGLPELESSVVKIRVTS